MMIIKDLIDKYEFRIVTGEEHISRELKGLYCCDLLSWVMSHGKQHDAWITVQTHTNIVAVASLLDIGCIIVPENISIDKETIDKASEEHVAILSTPLSAYNIFCCFYELGLR
ncbi:serine kinase of HPr protein (carbohydrate metabolism regulator) [Anaerosolibacter carboniphilus]|uniref:Serine kinase of HPr protein (Carbohydrate metabolism regulator) n=1 Tax=Anaerosolibacter carboniphilus TaxID=1417629 RepID=A0A841KXN9_9FIRM|nr:AraC family transcriptional regulator [Anaerosolibacter carboniphilus]MBB6214915.1 serine kinase of HPr protein (carbohydrate metabolism regulator) [Anaerosolibacter carboniphilus]